MSDTVRALGFHIDTNLVAAIIPQAIADDTPIVSSAIDTTLYPRKRILFVAYYNEVGATTHTVAYTFTDCDTIGGSYASMNAARYSGTALTAVSADTAYLLSIDVDPARPYFKVTATGSHADVDGAVAAFVLFIGDAL